MQIQALVLIKKRMLGSMDKFEPVSGGSDVNHAEEAFVELVISGCDGVVDFQTPEEAFDVIALPVARRVMFLIRRFERPGMTAWMSRRARSVGIASAS
jgi:hypothetical protein